MSDTIMLVHLWGWKTYVKEKWNNNWSLTEAGQHGRRQRKRHAKSDENRPPEAPKIQKM